MARLPRKAHITEEGLRRKKGKSKGLDLMTLAENLQKLTEDDLVQVVQMIHDHKGEGSYTKNDIEAGEFHVDLFTLPEGLIKMLWDFTVDQTFNSP